MASEAQSTQPEPVHPTQPTAAKPHGSSVFDQIVGQPTVVQTLRHTVATPSAMTHAWLFTGPPGSGRSVAARAFAAALECELDDERGCGECQGCRTTLAGSHPDVDLVATSETFIKVDQARQLAQRAAHRPVMGNWRILVVEDADRLNEQAANALLLAIEEPPPRTIWMLCAPTLEDVIVTIRSRCRHILLGTPPVAAVAELLARRDGIDPGLAEYAARAAQSHIGIAKRLATDEHARARRRELVAIPASLTGLGAALQAAADVMTEAGGGADELSGDRAEAERRELLSQLGADPDARVQPPAVRSHLKELAERQKREARRQRHDSIDAALTDLASVYRDALILRSGSDIVGLVNSTEQEQVETLAAACSSERLLVALDRIGLARQRLIANGAPLLVLEAMMIGLILPKRPAWQTGVEHQAGGAG